MSTVQQVGIARERTFAGELRQLDRNLVGTAWTRVIEADEPGFSDSVRHKGGSESQKTRYGFARKA